MSSDRHIPRQRVRGVHRSSSAANLVVASIVIVCGWLLWVLYVAPGPSKTASERIPGAHEDTTPLLTALPSAAFDSASALIARLPSVHGLPVQELETTPPMLGIDRTRAMAELYHEPGVVTGAAPHAVIIPVDGVRPSELSDTYPLMPANAPLHDGIDIIAPEGTPVIAAVDGAIARLHYGEEGGLTVYQYNRDSSRVYFYAHLAQYADDLTRGRFVHQGDVIGYVGDTGEAQPGNYHLHFAIWHISDPKDFWNGEPIDPYPLLIGHRR